MANDFNEKKMDYYDGHQVLFEYHVHYLAGKFFWQAVNNYDTNCRCIPTSWMFGMQIQLVPINGKVKIPVTLKRNDTLNKPVDAFITLRFADVTSRSFFDDLKGFGRRFVMPGDEIKENIEGCIPITEKRRLFNEELLVTVGIRIRSCHLEKIKNPSPSLSTDKKKKLCSMM